MERRAIASPVSLRAKADGVKYFTGLAAVFPNSHDPDGTQYQLWEDVIEQIDAHAFDSALERKDDAAGLFNHDPDNLLGRVSADTLQLSLEEAGLRYEIPYDEQDPDHQRVARKIERGDLAGSSFAFRAKRVEWIEEESRAIRLIKDVELYDVGPVTYPAYQATTAATRSAEAKQEYDAWREQQQEQRDQEAAAAAEELDHYDRRLKLAAAD